MGIEPWTAVCGGANRGDNARAGDGESWRWGSTEQVVHRLSTAFTDGEGQRFDR